MARAKKQNSGKRLVIVESPAKAKTINRYLGSDYEVMASMGHVRDLPPNDFGVDLERGFRPTYETLSEKKKVVASLRKAAAGADDVYLATDLDREGEAIAWHLEQALELQPERTRRVVFNEITKSAIKAAFERPLQLDMDKVNAQQARRLLDRIVGYQLSPLLQSKIARGLSAGRVQSVAVRLIVEREKEIRDFVPEESWQIQAVFCIDQAKANKLQTQWQSFISGHEDRAGRGKSTAGSADSSTGPTVKAKNAWLQRHDCFEAELVKFSGSDFRSTKATEAREVVESLGVVVESVRESAWEAYADKDLKIIEIVGTLDPEAAPEFTVRDIQKRRTTTKPNAPFTTASLQQAASSEVGFSPSRTMRIAQQLYEGVDIGAGEGPVGLITYMRTDSTNLSTESVGAARKLISEEHGKAYLPDAPNVFGSSKRAQEAHEAIRPSDVTIHPERIRDHLTRDQYRLYDLIWRRFVACQMTPAQWDGTTVLVGAAAGKGEAIFRATGRQLAFDGFYKVMGLPSGDTVMLPELRESQPLTAIDVRPRQQYTSPPSRYSEAALVKKLEAEGIGRPSTYAAIIQTIQDRSYVELRDRRLFPTARGEVVTEKLLQHFPQIMDLKFTSYMEEELDKIEEAHLDWVHVLNEFYEPFKAALEKAQTEMERARAEPSEYTCPECGRQMVYRLGKNGRFLACSGYPECKASMNVDAEGKPVAEVVAEEPCPNCGKPMVLRKSRLGPFLGCTGYPECSTTIPADEDGRPLRRVKPEDIKEQCPECGAPMNVKFARGRAFLGCSTYPKCKATKPLPAGVYVEKPKPAEAGARCDKCGRPMVIRSSKRGPFLSCSGFPRCRNAMPLDKLEELRAKEEAGEIPEAPPESANGNGKGRNGNNVPRKPDGKIDIAALGPPPPGFAWTRTGKPVVETWPDEPLTCPDCGREVTLKSGRFGPYYSCSNYPKCKFTANLRGDAKKKAEAEMPAPSKPKPIPTDVACSECGANMVIRHGRTGPFLGCSKYPKCRNSQPLPEGETVESLATAEA
ncbi:MAG: type I DNA topoisomerase [Phycisphaerae bacterium]|nr:type I DNA topoisomerase [Phycisphaerae bacterium]